MRTVQRATLPLALLAFLAAAPASAASWSHWPLDAGGGAKFRAEFEPAADSRFTSFSRNAGLNYYTSTYCGMDYPGSIAIHCDECGGGAESIQGGAFRMELAVFAVDRDKSGAPALPEDTHFASNPVLPFGTPPGDMGRAILTSSAEFPAGAEFPLRAALPLLGRRHRLLARDNHLLRVCWALRAVTPDGERLLARGILPDAFLPPGAYGLDTATLLIGTATDAKHKEGRTLPATPFSFGNWPFLASHIAAVRVEPGGEALLSKQLGGGDEVFFRRLSLLGIGVSATDPESEALRAAAKAPPPLVFPNCGQPRQSNDSLFSTLRPIMGIKGPKDKSDLTGDQRLKAAEVDG
ncbi:MAG: hypothetical protein IJP66_00305, partial [Kiritimatiellae bacterium]|nr:hypothetical protein [Kiritimatiellia bacterium]